MNKTKSLVVVLVVLVNSAFAQLSTSSPYSRFGLGDLQTNLLPELSAFGGGATAFSSSSSINPSNPASYTGFKANSFLFSTGGLHKTTNMQNTTASQITNNTSFSHLTMAFPISKKFGASVGLLPYSTIGYELNARDEINEASMTYSGDGGISKIYFGGAYKVSEAFSVGVNASYLFGGLNRRKLLEYDDETFYNSKSNSRVSLKGYYYELGLLYKKKLKENKSISFGLVLNNDSEIRAKRVDLVQTFSAVDVLKDTYKDSTEWGYATLPQYISGGITYKDGEKWLLIADYSMQNWSDYTLLGESDGLSNSVRLSGGMQYTPEYNSVTKYYKRMQYRLGVAYATTPLKLNNTQLEEMNLSFGFGIPVKKSRTKYDVSFTLGQRGTTDNSLIKEEFIRVGLSVTYDGLWFVKRKYN